MTVARGSGGKEVIAVPQVQVERVVIPPGSTIGYGFGRTLDGSAYILFGGDHRPMRTLGESIEAGVSIVAEIPDESVILRIADPSRDGG